MHIFAPGVQTPLSNLGSKCQLTYRYCDFGFDLFDTAHYNVDVEGLYWSPAGGEASFDSYTEFEIRLAHASCVPDEFKEGNLPKWQHGKGEERRRGPRRARQPRRKRRAAAARLLAPVRRAHPPTYERGHCRG